MQLHFIDYTIMLIYVCFVVGIGFALKRSMRTSADFFLSNRSIPASVCSLAFLSANLGATALVGMAASGAKYGLATCHFYWLGAILAMTFLGVFMMPFYYGSKARSVPEYLKLRFDERTRAFNACSFAVLTLFASGISIDLLAQLLQALLGWNYFANLVVCSLIVLVYVLKGGLTSAIYTEVLQFFMIVLGFAPVVWLGMKNVGGWDSLKNQLQGVAENPVKLGLNTHSFAPDAWTSMWKPIIAGPAANPMGVDLFAMVFGLSFVLAFGYWCTDFLVIQRAMAAKDMNAARLTPIIATLPKMLLPALVILPGMIAVGLASTGKDGYRLPPVAISPSAQDDFNAKVEASLLPAGQKTYVDPGKLAAELSEKFHVHFNVKKIAEITKMPGSPSIREVDARLQDAVTDVNFNGVILSLLRKYCPPGLMGLALTALMASFMSGMAGNVTAFNTVWTYDIYQSYIRPNQSDAHYMRMGGIATCAGVLLSMGCAYFAHQFQNAMDTIQLVFGFVNAPLFATFLLGMFWSRATNHGAFFGLLCGTATSALFHIMTISRGNEYGFTKGGILIPLFHLLNLPDNLEKHCYFESDMAKNFWMASFAFSSCFLITIAISLATRRTKSDEELKGLVYSLTERIREPNQAWYATPGFLGSVMLAICLALNIYFW